MNMVSSDTTTSMPVEQKAFPPQMWRVGFAIFFIFFGLTLLALRFLHSGETVFALDEPLFQMLLDKHIEERTIPLTSFRGSSIPLAYGAGGLWFLAFFRIFSSTPEGNVLVHAFFYTLGNFFLLLFLWRRHRSTVPLIFWLIFSSPFLYIFARHTWDNTMLVPLSSAVFLLLVRAEEVESPIWSLMLIGFICALMLNIHLMAGPFVLAAGLALCPLLVRAGWKRGTFWLLAGLVPFLLLLLPYLWEAILLYGAEAVGEKTSIHQYGGNGRNLWWLLQRQFIFLSHWGMRSQYNSGWEDLLSFIGFPHAAFIRNDYLGWIPKIAALLMVFSIPFSAWKKKKLPAMPERILFLSTITVLVVLNFLNISTEPHYFHTTWWISFLGLALVLDRANGWWRKALLFFIVCTAFLNSVLIWKTHTYVHRYGGMRNLSFGLSVTEQRKLIEELCEKSQMVKEKELLLYFKDSNMVDPAAQYFFKKLPACAGLSMRAVWDKDRAHWVFRYKDEMGPDAHLVIERGKEI